MPAALQVSVPKFEVPPPPVAVRISWNPECPASVGSVPQSTSAESGNGHGRFVGTPLAQYAVPGAHPGPRLTFLIAGPCCSAVGGGVLPGFQIRDSVVW